MFGEIVSLVAASIALFNSTSPSQWDELSKQVGGRLYQNVPFAQSCFTEPFGSPNCTMVRNTYTDELTRSSFPGAYIQTQWETCQTTGQQCLLDYINPNNTQPTTEPCQLGSIPSYYIDVINASDVSAAFAFSKETKIPIVIKNTGHDYQGRSSAPGSLALWTHNLKNITLHPNFVPEGCSSTALAVTLGAGVQWGEAYDFADANNITLVGGSDKSVGVVGGWLQGGGHSALSNTMGMGVDRVLQYKVVTPDGQLRTVNSCQNQDLFFALRGGGGGTFGVVLEATVLASPPVTLQTVIVGFQNPNATLTQEMWTILADNGLKWAAEGWGGFSTSEVVILINPNISTNDAATSMAPLINFGDKLEALGVVGAQLTVVEFPSWSTFFNAFTASHVAIVGSSLAIASRLIDKSLFETPENKTALVSGLQAANAATPGLIILLATPFSFKSDNQTSVTERWRTSLYHVTVVSPWNWNATASEKEEGYKQSSLSIDNLRKISPDAAYLNEADVYEPNYQVSFWGTHYPELLSIKKKYDPEQLLDCWHCVGWENQSPRFSCYFDENAGNL